MTHHRISHAEERAPCGTPGLSPVFVRREKDGASRIDLSDCLVSQPKPWLLIIWEPLRTKAPAPPKAQPFCCFVQSVIFYHSPYIAWPYGGYWRDREGKLRWPSTRCLLQWDRTETRLAWNDIVDFDGEEFECGGGRVVWARRQWWMCHWASRKRARAAA